MRIACTFIICLITACQLQGQEAGTVINLKIENQALSLYLEKLTELSGYEFSYNPAEISSDSLISVEHINTPFSSVLEELRSFMIEYRIMGDHIILRRSSYARSSEKKMKTPRFTISGYITDSLTGESLIGATVADMGTGKGAAANGYGFYSITLEEGDYSLTISYLGYSPKKITVELRNNISVNHSLEAIVSSLEEIVVISENAENFIENTRISQVEMRSESFRQIPGFLGEPDVIKSLQSLPGINFYSDGSTIFHVRGGDRDQNMILIDEAPVYNPAHLLGIFSTFTPESINSINIYKGDMPATYGGRLSSLIDVKLREGNTNKLALSGNTGPVATTLNFQGPMFMGKSSFYISARRSHLKWLLSEKLPDLEKLHFSDFNIKYNHRINDKNRIYFSFYSGIDNFKNRNNATQSSGITWINNAGTLRWNHLFGERLFSNSSLIISNYDYNLFVNYEQKQRWNTGISLVALKSDFAFYARPGHTYKMGLNIASHFYSPGNFYAGYFTNPVLRGVSPRQAVESSLYFSFEDLIGTSLNIRYGLRFTSWNNTGPATEYVYDDLFEPIDTVVYSGKSSYHTYSSVEPRISIRYNVESGISLKLALSRNSQFEYLIGNSISPFTSLETWLPAGPNIRPLFSDQVTAGFTLEKGENNDLSLDIEGFYKHISNYIGYVDHAYMLFNPHVEGELRYGEANSFGIEILGRKTSGRLQGWISYTLTRIHVTIPGINNGRTFPARYDRPHNFGIFSSYRLKPRWSVSANWLYSSGNPITTPTGYYMYNGYQVPFYEERNNDRLPAYHRLDLATEIEFTKPGSSYEHSLRISIYNAYGRKNPFAINFNKIINDSGVLVVPVDHSVSPELQPSMIYIYGMVPSISYHFKF